MKKAKYNNNEAPTTETEVRNIKFTPEIKIKIIQINPITNVWPKSGWITKSDETNNVSNREKENFKTKFENFLKVMIKLKTIIKNGLTNSMGCNLGKKNKSNHLFEPLTSTPIIGTRNNINKDKQKT